MRIPLILSGLVYVALGILMAALPSLIGDQGEFPPAIFYALGVFTVLLGVAVIFFAGIVHKPSPTYYIIAFVITVMYLPSLFLPFGIPMLIFLLRKEVREHYKINF